ncbi:hypothetical protein PVAND_012657 [Polypedilum vanderplanki]|uniref:BED-type domain-containing protein n=1 Tax=Polypedilum vanderplanki TaxID=319348 RepID=A0A9J6CN72_POLVA|nr:hypothetical protein PVAND_012657 [Polypedilum vanderplanki]
MSLVWKLFIKLNTIEAKCCVKEGEKTCGCVLKRSGGTKGLLEHLKRKHNISQKDPSQIVSIEEPPVAKKQKLMFDYLNQSSLEKDIAQMICCDNMTYQQVSSSEFLQTALKQKYTNKKIPKIW